MTVFRGQTPDDGRLSGSDPGRRRQSIDPDITARQHELLNFAA
jgi:hypothetical protein